MSKFTHLHVHTHYSILDGAAKIKPLLERAKELEMTSLAITDHGNMYGIPEFTREAKKAGIKPLIGVETYVARNGVENKSGREDRSGYHLILLAQNKTGYFNLVNLISRSYTEGFYYTPRLSKDWLSQHSEGLIASSACLGGEIAQMIMKRGREDAEKSLQSYLDIFGDNFYLELMNHGYEEQKTVNTELAYLSKKYNVKLIVTNDVHFIRKDDFEAHRLLISINTGKDSLDDALHYTGNEYLKSDEEIRELFSEYSEAIENTIQLADSIEEIVLKTDPIMPVFNIPEEFENDDEYLRHLTFEGARRLYGEVSGVVLERIENELSVISKLGFPGYFLIVQDLVKTAAKMGVLVGPGRGSAAGSIIAYCIGITKIDPIKYKLLFERFLNDSRVSLPDIDIDFDDEGREKVFQYIVEKYGREKVAQIVTFGTLGGKSAIRDVARIMGLDLSSADRFAKLFPEGADITLEKALKANGEFKDAYEKGTELEKQVLDNARKLEGTIRQTGVHACGTLIGRQPLLECIPLSIQKGLNIPVSQYEGTEVEDVGMLKMDILGLKTLSIIKTANALVCEKYRKTIDIDEIPLDDDAVFKLFQQGETIGIFQFESVGMRKWLKELHPNNIEDLIAMNALYRPGPMDFISPYIESKFGRQPVKYPHPLLEDLLKNTYGIMVYQEQIMEAARILAGFTLTQADILRKAMGKKNPADMEKQRKFFIDGCKSVSNIEQQQAEEIFETIKEFSKYGFNRSHAAAYSVLAIQTAYFKVYYPAQFLAATLTHNISDLKKITFFIDEAKRMGIKILGPDINESYINFSVTDDGSIRFGLNAIKNMGEGAAQALIEERNKNGQFTNMQDFLKRINTRTINKKGVEALAYAGGFDRFGVHRAQFFYKENDNSPTFIDLMLKHANYIQSLSGTSQQSLFGSIEDNHLPELQFPNCEPFTKFQELEYEKQMTGFYINSHPIDEFKFEISYFCNSKLQELSELSGKENKEVTFAGCIVAAVEKISKNNTKYGTFTIEDETGSLNFTLFSETYLKFKHLLEQGVFVFCQGKVQQQYNNTRLEIRMSSMIPLQEMGNKIKSAELVIPQVYFPEIADSIISAVKTFRGKIPVNFVVVGDKSNGNNGLNVRLVNSKFTVNQQFLKFAFELEHCKLNIVKEKI